MSWKYVAVSFLSDCLLFQQHLKKEYTGTLYATANTQSLAYDGNGNRTSGTTNGTSRTYTNSTTSNKLTNLSNPAVTYTYTNNGNVQSDGTNTFTYDARNRLTKVVNATGTFTYTLNALGQRMTKEIKNTSNVVTDYTAFAYNPQGQLIGEYDLKNSKIINEYVWLYDIPVVLIRYDLATGITKWYAINVDHLGTPRRITDPANNHATVWNWETLPNGETQLDTASQNFGVNLRLPGQYFDKETGLHYNYFRSTYHPQLGRYMEVDPIGLRGGLNPYLYVGGNAVNNIDPFGLYGTTSCAYYGQRCQQSGGKDGYYCKIAPAICSITPEIGNWTACVRQCLQDADKKVCGTNDGCVDGSCTTGAHIDCWAECAKDSSHPSPNLPK